MFSSFTYKQKCLVLPIAFVLCGFIIYHMAIANTITLQQQCNTLQRQLIMLKDVSKQIASLKKNITEVDNRFGNRFKQINNIHESLLFQISDYCENNDILLTSYPEVHSFTKQDFEINTSRATLQGPFMKIVKLLFKLEQEWRIGKIASVYFLTEYNLKKKKTYLKATIYIQHVKKI